MDLDARMATLEEKVTAYEELKTALEEPVEEVTEERTKQEEQAVTLVLIRFFCQAQA